MNVGESQEEADLRARIVDLDDDWKPIMTRANADQLRRVILGGLLLAAQGESIDYLETSAPGPRPFDGSVQVTGITPTRVIELRAFVRIDLASTSGSVEGIEVWSRRPLLAVDLLPSLATGYSPQFGAHAATWRLSLTYPGRTPLLLGAAASQAAEEEASAQLLALLPSLLDDLRP